MVRKYISVKLKEVIDNYSPDIIGLIMFLMKFENLEKFAAYYLNNSNDKEVVIVRTA